MSSLHNEVKYGARLVGAIGQAVGLGDGNEGVIRLSETLQAGIDPWSLPEWAYLRTEVLGGGTISQIAVVGEFSACGVWNNTAGLLVIVEAVRDFTTGTTRNLQYVHPVAVTTLATAGGGVLRDRRSLTDINTLHPDRVSLISGSDPASIGLTLDVLIGTEIDFMALPVVLYPGEALVVQGTVVNTALTRSCFRWRSREMFPAERRTTR